MSNPPLSYRIFQSGDNAVILDYGNLIDRRINKEVIARFNQFRESAIPGVIEIVPAYSSLLFYYDVIAVKKSHPGSKTASAAIQQEITNRLMEPVEQADDNRRRIRIPVCYEMHYAPDMPAMIQATGLSADVIINEHTSRSYHVYMLGFLPGFAYMGEVNDNIAISRKSQPVPVRAGSVGIAGIQTGIYSIDSPGGWNIIGRTPWRLFDSHSTSPALLEPGDAVEFYSISADEFARY